MMPGEIFPAPGELELNDGRRNPITHRGRQHRRPADPGRQPLSFLRDQRGAEVRPQARQGHAARHRRRHRGALRARPVAHRAAHALPRRRARATASRPGSRASSARSPRSARRTKARPRISRAAYADMFGPTVGDKVRLADTDLFIEVEKDHTIYGEEVKFGGGKVIRDGMGQSQRTRAQGAVDTVITNALILDHWGIVKADIGLKDGRIVAHRQGRQSRRPAGRRHRHRPGHRGDRRRGQDRHRGRHRLPHPFHLPAADRGRALQRRHHHDGRRHRSGARHARHHRARRAPGTSAACCRRPKACR